MREVNVRKGREKLDKEVNKDYILINELDSNFKYQIATQPGGEDIKHCFACGTCTATCPLAEIDKKYNPRRVIRMALLGMKEEVFRSDFVWICSSHYNCSQRCPQGVDIGSIANVVRKLVLREGYAPSTGNESNKSNKSKVISSSELDLDFKYQIVAQPGGESITRCFACGTCTADCPERERDSRYNPRKFIRMILMGMKEQVFQDEFFWLCSTHYRCTKRCPQGVNIKGVMNAIENIALKEGYSFPFLTLEGKKTKGSNEQ